MIKILVQDEQYTADEVFQWDVGQTLEIHGLNLDFSPEVHFSKVIGNKIGVINRKGIVSSDGVITVDIPDVLLETPIAMNIYICKSGEDYFVTMHKYVVVVRARPQPTDYVHADEEVLIWKTLEEKNKELQGQIDGVCTIIAEEIMPDLENKADKADTYTKAEVEERDMQLQTSIDATSDYITYQVIDGDIRPELATKADKTTVAESTETAYVFEFSNLDNTEVRLGEASSVSFTFGDGEYSETYTSGLSFDSGETATAIDYTDSGILNWVGTDCAMVDGLSIFQPSASTHYDIVFYFNGSQFIGLVNGFVPSVSR